MTRDIDIVIEIQGEGSKRLQKIFKDDFYVDPDSIDEAVARRGMFNIIHSRHVIKLDFIVRKESVYRKLEFERRKRVEMEGVPVWIRAPEDLILSKLDWAKDSHSELQLGDVKNLLHTLKNIDQTYLKKWIDALGLGEIYGRVKGE